ncbi:hypothetical protein RI367_008400 [Sorochytrium milnesiophthora]
MLARLSFYVSARVAVRSPSACLRRLESTASGPSQDLVDKLKTELKNAMRAKDAFRSTVIRGVLSDITYAQKSPNPPSEYYSLVHKAAKKREESIRMFTEASRADLADKEGKELEVLKQFLPREPSDQELQDLVTGAIAAAGASSPSDMGKVMRQLDGNAALAGVNKKKLVDLIKAALSH